MQRKQISVGDLRLGMYVLELDRPWLGTSFLFQGFEITSQEQITQLQRDCKHVHISKEYQPTASPKLTMDARPLVRGTKVYEERVPVEKELHVSKEIYASCEKNLRSSLNSLRTAGKMDPQSLRAVVTDMTRSIERNPDAMMLLHRIKQKNNTDFDRAISTSIHMITLGRFLQFSSEHLELLGLAGLLLDIGKLGLPDAIVNKKDVLDDDEYELSKQHVQNSIKLIADSPKFPKELAEIVAQHHERLDGSGYPHGLSGTQISIDGAIAGLTNSYCALISQRDYAEQFSPSNALNTLYRSKGTLFHEALVEQLIQCIGIYPVGSTVELNSGEIGIVIAQNLVRRLQPRVMLILDSAWQVIRPQTILDLVREPRTSGGEIYQILHTIASENLPIDPSEFFL